jgi:hypothetical protein
MTKRGPYVTEDYSRVMLPASSYSWNEARHEAASWAQEFIEGWGRSRFIEKKAVGLHDHDDWEDCIACPDEPAYIFEIYEGSWHA